jgi:hypothetical protein
MKMLLLVLMVASTALVGCGKKQSGKAPISQARGTRSGGISGDTVNSSGVLDGAVVRYSTWSNADFQQTVTDFLGASIQREFIGEVSGDPNQSTGVVFGAQIQPASGYYTPNMNTQLSPNGHILVAVYDTFTGQKDAEGNTIPPMAVYVQGISGNISNNVLRAQASDSFGVLHITAQISGSQISGNIWYENLQNANGGSPVTNDLGYFQAPTCSVLVCN